MASAGDQFWYEPFEEWLASTAPVGWQQTLVALRAAMRALPAFGGRKGGSLEPEGDKAILMVLESLFKSQVQVRSQVNPIKVSFDYIEAEHLPHQNDSGASSYVEGVNGLNIGDLAYSVFMTTQIESADLAWMEIEADVKAVDAASDLSSTALWSISHPDWFSTMDAAMRSNWITNSVYSFWLRWWDGVLTGKQLDWDLQERVALIPDEVWKAGPVAVAERIRLIEEQMRLLWEAERLKVELAAARNEVAALSKRSHNSPPELVEPVAEIEQQAGEIAEALEAAAEELKQDAPRAAVLRRAGAALVAAAGKAISYCASLGDVALKKAAEETGSLGAKALIGAGLLAWMSQLEAVKTLARALEAFAKLLGG